MSFYEFDYILYDGIIILAHHIAIINTFYQHHRTITILHIILRKTKKNQTLFAHKELHIQQHDMLLILCILHSLQFYFVLQPLLFKSLLQLLCPRSLLSRHHIELS